MWAAGSAPRSGWTGKGLAVAWASWHLGLPVRWAETRSENLVGMTHGRAQRQTITLGGTRDGRILAYRLDVVQDTGAFPRMSAFLPRHDHADGAGPYQIPHVETAFRVVVTNTTPIYAYRGAGRPEATAAIERTIDRTPRRSAWTRRRYGGAT